MIKQLKHGLGDNSFQTNIWAFLFYSIRLPVHDSILNSVYLSCSNSIRASVWNSIQLSVKKEIKKC